MSFWQMVKEILGSKLFQRHHQPQKYNSLRKSYTQRKLVYHYNLETASDRKVRNVNQKPYKYLFQYTRSQCLNINITSV